MPFNRYATAPASACLRAYAYACARGAADIHIAVELKHESEREGEEGTGCVISLPLPKVRVVRAIDARTFGSIFVHDHFRSEYVSRRMCNTNNYRLNGVLYN